MNTEYNLDLVIQAKNEASAQLQKVSNDVKKMKENVDNTKDSVSGLTSKQRQLNLKANTENLKRELQDIRTEILNLESSSASPENLARLDQLQQEYANVKQQIIANTQAMNDLGVATKSSTSLIGSLITKLGGIASITMIVKGLVNVFNEFQQSQRILIETTGATGDSLRGLETAMLDVQGTVNQSQNEIAEAIGEVNTRLGITGDKLSEITSTYLSFADITGQQGKQAIADNVKMFNSWGVATDEQSKYLDQLAYAGQRTGIDVQQLTTNLQQNSATLQQMGFSLTDSISLLSQFEQQGVEANSTLQAMKIGITNLVQDGIAPSEAWNTIIANIQNAKDDTEAWNIACEYFGNRGGASMFKAIRSGTVDIKAMNQELENSIGTIERTDLASETLGEFLSRKWSGIVADFIQWNNEGFRATQELAGVISNELSPSIEKAENYIDSWKKAIVGTIQGEVERTYENGVLTASLNEQGVASEQARVKAEQLKQAEENAIAITNQYAQSGELLNKALATFDALKIDDSTTRSEFEQSKNSALALAQSFQVALASKLALAKTDYKEAIQSKDIHQVAQAYQNLNYLMNEQVALQGKIAEIQNSTWSGKTTGGGGSGSGKSNADKEAEAYAKAREKEFVAMQKAHKEYLKQKEKEEKETNKKLYNYAKEWLSDQEKVITDLNKKYEEEYDKIEKKVKETSDKIKSINKDIESLTKSINDLGKDENKSLAQEFITARDELKKMEKEAKGIQQVAENTSWSELENLDSGFIGGFNVEYIKKYKTYLDEVNSLYEGMNDEQIKSLDEQIAYQEKYNSMNRIEQIKEDYRVKREEIEAEKQAKLDSLQEEQNKLNDLNTQKETLQKQRVDAVSKEQKAYDDMYKLIQQFQKNYMKQLAEDRIQERKIIADLEEGRKRVAIAKANAQSYGSDVEGRASGGPVQFNTPYIVGEKGPELFVPNSNGTIIPNDVINNNGIEINISGITVRSEADIDVITDEIIRKIKLEKQFGIS